MKSGHEYLEEKAKHGHEDEPGLTEKEEEVRGFSYPC